MIITLAFKKQTSTKFLDKLIAGAIKWRTKSKYFHIEMIVKNDWISTNPDVGAVYITPLHNLNDHYDYVDVKMHGANVKKMVKFAQSQLGKKYDWKGILLSQTIPLNIEDKDKWFCSEIVAEMLEQGGYKLSKPSNQYSPEDIYKMVTTPI